MKKKLVGALFLVGMSSSASFGALVLEQDYSKILACHQNLNKEEKNNIEKDKNSKVVKSKNQKKGEYNKELDLDGAMVLQKGNTVTIFTLEGRSSFTLPELINEEKEAVRKYEFETKEGKQIFEYSAQKQAYKKLEKKDLDNHITEVIKLDERKPYSASDLEDYNYLQEKLTKRIARLISQGPLSEIKGEDKTGKLTSRSSRSPVVGENKKEDNKDFEPTEEVKKAGQLFSGRNKECDDFMKASLLLVSGKVKDKEFSALPAKIIGDKGRGQTPKDKQDPPSSAGIGTSSKVDPTAPF